jgi:hypothetical protein
VYSYRDNKEVYDAELFGIVMVIKHAEQRLSTDSQKIMVLQTHKLHFIVSNMTRRTQDRPLRELSRALGETTLVVEIRNITYVIYIMARE